MNVQADIHVPLPDGDELGVRPLFFGRRRARRPILFAFLACLLAGSVPVAFAGEAAEEKAAVAGVAERETTGLAVADFHATDPQIARLIESLLADNPIARSAWFRAGSLSQREAQARSLPDPLLTYRYFVETPETRVGSQRQGLEISQGIPWAGKRSLQAGRARTLAEGSAWEAADLERALVADLKRAYFDAAYLQEALGINAEERDLLRQFEQIALRRYATGRGIQQDVIKVQTDLSRLEDRETDLRERLDAVVRRIADRIGRPEKPLALDRIVLALPDGDPVPAGIEEQATREHPGVRAIERRIEADRLWEKRRRLEARPDFRFGLGYIQVDPRRDPAALAMPPDENGKDVFALTFGINIPLYRKRIRAGIAEARESRRAATEALDGTRDRLRFQVQEAVLRFRSLDRRTLLYRDVILPQARESLSSAEAAYTTGRKGFLDLLDAERVLFEARLAYRRLISDAWNALADLERAAARPVPEIPPGSPPKGAPGKQVEPES